MKSKVLERGFELPAAGFSFEVDSKYPSGAQNGRLGVQMGVGSFK